VPATHRGKDPTLTPPIKHRLPLPHFWDKRWWGSTRCLHHGLTSLRQASPHRNRTRTGGLWLGEGPNRANTHSEHAQLRLDTPLHYVKTRLHVVLQPTRLYLQPARVFVLHTCCALQMQIPKKKKKKLSLSEKCTCALAGRPLKWKGSLFQVLCHL
jgi:hypothetical protein